MTDPPSRAGPTVTVRDRRTLPFFQVHLKAVRSIRETVAGPRRTRTVGFYGLLCQLANEQRHVGNHVRVHVSYDELCRRARVGRTTVKALLDAVGDADIVRVEHVRDRATGITTTILHLLCQEPPWSAVTVPMAERLAEPRPDGNLLRDLGLVIMLLELFVEQGRDRGGLEAEISRAGLAGRTGIQVRRLVDCIQSLESAGVVNVERRQRRCDTGKQLHLPSIYSLVEPSQGVVQNGDRDGAERGLGSCKTSTDVAQNEDSAGGAICTTPGPRTAPLKARGGSVPVENGIERPSPQTPRSGSEVAGRGGEDESSASEDLCDALCAVLEPLLGDAPRQAFRSSRRQWLGTADAILGRHSPDRIDDALRQIPREPILGSQALTMSGFAKHLDELLFRARCQPSSPDAGRARNDHPGMVWSDARQALGRAILRYGRARRAAALVELAPQDERFEPFVRRVGWAHLCEREMRYEERRFAALWADLGRQPWNPEGKESSA